MPIPPPARRAAATLVLLYLGLVLVQAAYLPATPFMSVFFDEYLYDAMAVEIARGQAPTMNRVLPPRYPPLYPALEAPLVLLLGTERFGAMRILNAVLYSTMLFAAYGLARRFVRPLPAVACALASVLGPGLVNPPLFFAENLYYPLFVFYVLGLVRTLESPSVGRGVVAGLLGAAAFWTKVMALLPVGLAGGLLLLPGGPGFRRRLPAAVAHATVFGLLVLPFAVGLASLSMTLEEAEVSGPTSLAGVAGSFLQHVLALLIGLGPLPVALALAFGAGALLRRRRAPVERQIVLLFFALALATVGLAAGWIATVEPGRARVEERYQVMVYPLLLCLAFAAIERPPRGWRLGFAAVSALLLAVSTFQLDPARGTFWVHVNPSPLLLHFAAIAHGEGPVKVVFVSLWAVAAAPLLLPARSPLRRLAWLGPVGAGLAYLALVGGPFQALKRIDVRESRRDLQAVTRLLEAHRRPGDRIVFAGAMAARVPYAAATLLDVPYWHQHGVDPVRWFPGTLDVESGALTWRLGRAERLLLLARDGATRGGRRLGREGEWILYALEPPRLESLLVEAPPRGPGVDRHVKIYLWPLAAGWRRLIRVEAVGSGHPCVRYRLLRPEARSGWRPVGEGIEAELPPIRSLLELEIRGGAVEIAIRREGG